MQINPVAIHSFRLFMQKRITWPENALWLRKTGGTKTNLNGAFSAYEMNQQCFFEFQVSFCFLLRLYCTSAFYLFMNYLLAAINNSKNMKNKSHTKCESNGGERNINSSLRVLNCCKEVMYLRQACMEAGSKLNHLTDVSLSNFV